MRERHREVRDRVQEPLLPSGLREPIPGALAPTPMETRTRGAAWERAVLQARQRRCCTGDEGLARQVVERASAHGVTLDARRVREDIEDGGCGTLAAGDDVDDPWSAVEDALDAREE